MLNLNLKTTIFYHFKDLYRLYHLYLTTYQSPHYSFINNYTQKENDMSNIKKLIEILHNYIFSANTIISINNNKYRIRDSVMQYQYTQIAIKSISGNFTFPYKIYFLNNDLNIKFID